MIAALGITFLQFLACYEILTGSVERLMGSIRPQGHGPFLHDHDCHDHHQYIRHDPPATAPAAELRVVMSRCIIEEHRAITRD